MDVRWDWSLLTLLHRPRNKPLWLSIGKIFTITLFITALGDYSSAINCQNTARRWPSNGVKQNIIDNRMMFWWNTQLKQITHTLSSKSVKSNKIISYANPTCSLANTVEEMCSEHGSNTERLFLSSILHQKLQYCYMYTCFEKLFCRGRIR